MIKRTFHLFLVALSVTGLFPLLIPVTAQEPGEESGSGTVQKLERTETLENEIQFFIKHLDSGNPYLDDWSRRNLIQLGSAAVPSLLNALENANPRKRFLICEILGQIRDTKAVSALLSRLKDQEANPSVASAAARALGQIGDRRAIDPLIEALGSADTELVYNAVQALGALRARKAVGKITSLLDDERTTFYKLRIRNAALAALGKLRTKNEEALKKMKTMLTSDIASKTEKSTGLPVSYYVVRSLEQIALTTKGPIMVSGKEKKKTKQKTIDAWVSWINNELGIEEEQKKKQEEGKKKGDENKKNNGNQKKNDQKKDNKDDNTKSSSNEK